MKPAVGRIVHYRLSEDDHVRIIRTVNRPLTDGSSPLLNPTRPGDVLPAVVVRVWEDHSVNARVLLDGEVTLWVTGKHQGDGPGTWHWPERTDD